ncbi:rhomboid family intramembrane serine protease [Sphingomonas oligoaromativorans]|jgi:membrane associated rhomboid family serine protease|uniref:rhomboid family intramembrane serine protease n=1 Tax=Sphingomonas oligoaromativorans TaxID=575322 RepID=UPI0014205FC9|nr:rhomboid family intramembrane serine protease [Sphingomonas oligoaromativorans]NIJ32102.1 membrane associated rhomboid family serine protease [Sphingomonas oligoaromativorans]
MRLPPARATIAITVITGLAWLAAQAAGQVDRMALIAGFIPARISEGLALPGAVPVWLTPLSATLVHANLLHVGFNLLMIAFCGRLVEASVGPGGLVLLYLVGAYAAAAAEYLAMPTSFATMVGASGAGSAIIGAYALLYGKQRAKNWGPIPGRLLHVLWLAIGWIVIQAMLGFASVGLPGVPSGGVIATPAHIGGFLAGLALARPLLLFRYRSA